MTQFQTSLFWQDSANLPSFPTLDRDLNVDVVVIGAGITGITAAYLFKRAGRRVALVERATCGGFDTLSTTAHLTCGLDTPLTALSDSFGDDHGRAAWDAGLAAIAEIDQIVRTEGIDCDFAWVPGYLHVPVLGASDESDAADLNDEARRAASLGFDAEFTERVPFVDRPGMQLSDQARFNPGKYLRALLAVVDEGGSHVFEHTAVDEVSDRPLSVRAGGHTIACDYLVIATHNPLVDKASLIRATLLQTKLSLYTSYALAAKVPEGRVPDALFWDTADPYDYLRLARHRGGEYVIFGGEDHKTGQADDTRACFQKLERRLKQLLPEAEVTHRWSGQVIETNDGLPFIGEMAARQFAATGFSGNGMTFGTLGAMMAVDAALQRTNPWTELFDLGRTKIKGGLWDYLKENRDYPYYMARDRFAGSEGKSVRSVPRGTGKVLDLNGTRVAVYRDTDGTIVKRSAICTHMGCQVKWNQAEATWDCPCHGSRFGTEGNVLSGPAESPLAKVGAAK